MKFRLPNTVRNFGKKIKSQTDEDGLIEKIFAHVRPRSRYFVEFGCGPHWQDPEYKFGIEANCVLLRDRFGWNGLFMDGGDHPIEYNIQKEYVTATNINSLLRKYRVPDNLDIISIDIDSQDLWVFMALNYKPTLFIVEYNANFDNMNESVSVHYDAGASWDYTKYYGASLGAFNKVAHDKGYTLVCTNRLNAFYVLTDMLENPEDFPQDDLGEYIDQHSPDHLNRDWTRI